MKFLQSTLLIAAVSVLFFSCSKDTASYGAMTGKLVTNPTGECMPISVHGDYFAKAGYNSDNYVDVQVDVMATGEYSLSTDTVNGLSFSGSGRVGYGGLNTIRLYPGDSIPKVPGVTTLQLFFDSTNTLANTCVFDVNVLDPSTNLAAFTLGSTPGNCSGAIIGGVYKVGIEMTASNTIVLDVNVFGPGGFEITTAEINGVTFSAHGAFLNTGVQKVTLIGSGTPAASGIFNFPVTSASATCSFSLAFGI